VIDEVDIVVLLHYVGQVDGGVVIGYVVVLSGMVESCAVVVGT
jgi:hypothetical protein